MFKIIIGNTSLEREFIDPKEFRENNQLFAITTIKCDCGKQLTFPDKFPFDIYLEYNKKTLDELANLKEAYLKLEEENRNLRGIF